jgi:cyclopropane fatty-acyl-phospholipid synthase-like methyltransferase
MSSKAADRLVWTVKQMDLVPTDRVLEIGCGHGVAITLVCEQLSSGGVLGVDRSATMIEMAARRNADHVAAGRATFQTASLHEANLEGATFDKVLAIHVPVFLRGQPDRELEIVRDHLAADGRLFLSYQPLDSGHIGSTVDRLTIVLQQHGFAVSACHEADLPSGRTMCLVATIA